MSSSKYFTVPYLVFVTSYKEESTTINLGGFAKEIYEALKGENRFCLRTTIEAHCVDEEHLDDVNLQSAMIEFYDEENKTKKFFDLTKRQLNVFDITGELGIDENTPFEKFDSVLCDTDLEVDFTGKESYEHEESFEINADEILEADDVYELEDKLEDWVIEDAEEKVKVKLIDEVKEIHNIEDEEVRELYYSMRDE